MTSVHQTPGLAEMDASLSKVYINDLPEPFVLEEDGRLSLAHLELHPATINVQGILGLVGPDNITKRKWTRLVQLLGNPAEGAEELGTEANPLQVAGTPAVSGQAWTLECRQLLQDIFDMLREHMKEKLTVSISKIKSDTWLEVTSTAKLSFDIVEDLPLCAPSKTVPPFGWDDSNERAESYRYIPYLQENISLGSRDLGWVDAAKEYPLLLSYNGLETLGRNFRGTTDVLLADRLAVQNLRPEFGLRVLFALRKKVERPEVNQAGASLLLANLHCPQTRPVMVLTDLNDQWFLQWPDSSTIFQHCFASRAQAVGFIEGLVAGRFNASEGVEPDAARVAKRRKVADRLVASGADSSAFEEQMESLEGVLPPDELTQMRASLSAEQLFRSFAMSPYAPSWGLPERK